MTNDEIDALHDSMFPAPSALIPDARENIRTFARAILGSAVAAGRRDTAAPRRACLLTLKLEADSLPELTSALFNIAAQAERGEMTTGVSGGPSSGHIYELLHDATQTHSKYFEEVCEYLAAKKAKTERA